MTDEARKLAEAAAVAFDRDRHYYRDMIEALAKDFAAALSAAREEGRRWIPVEERLPERGEYVLVCTDDGMVTVAFAGLANVTHWQPLPSPPEARP